jgi:hypothetical protein
VSELLPGAAGAGDAEDRDVGAASRTAGGQRGVAARLEHGERAGQRRQRPGQDVLDGGRLGREVDVAGLDQGVDHARQAEPLAVLGGEDRHAARAQQGDLLRDDDAAAPAEDLDVAGAHLDQPVLEVAEVLDVAALVGADRHALDVLLQGRRDDVLDAPVVAEVHHLGPLRLQHPAHDVDGGVVAVEQARRRHEADRVRGHVQRHGGSSRRWQCPSRYLDVQLVRCTQVLLEEAQDPRPGVLGRRPW